MMMLSVDECKCSVLIRSAGKLIRPQGKGAKWRTWEDTHAKFRIMRDIYRQQSYCNPSESCLCPRDQRCRFVAQCWCAVLPPLRPHHRTQWTFQLAVMCYWTPKWNSTAAVSNLVKMRTVLFTHKTKYSHILSPQITTHKCLISTALLLLQIFSFSFSLTESLATSLNLLFGSDSNS